jgi:hypothetical protein
MNNCFLPIKRKIQILIFSLNLIAFIIIASYTTNNNENYVEYTNLSKIFSNIYIILTLLILLIHSISSKLICEFISEDFSFLTNDIGKIIINLSIGVLFWSSNNTPHVIFGIINFISSIALFISEFIFQFKIVKFIHFDTESNEDNNNENVNNSSNENNENKISNINKKMEIRQQVTNDKKGKNGSMMPLNEQNLNIIKAYLEFSIKIIKNITIM